MTTLPTLFVWRSKKGNDEDPNFKGLPAGVVDILHGGEECVWCQTRLEQVSVVRPVLIDSDRLEGGRAHERCPLCGWELFTREEPNNEERVVVSHLRWGVLKELSVADPTLQLNELGQHLTRRFADIYSLPPRRFEQLVADVFRLQGYQVRLTQQTRDGGCDIVLLEKSSGEQTLVECKRYAAKRTVGVSVVRELAGVQLQLGVPKAKVVVSSKFSSPARYFAKDINSGPSGYDLDLVDAGRLLTMLGNYDSNLPPLHLDSRLSTSRR